uniref:PINc domain-containing protein n=1 Tax=Haemonchus contortus TaxID=6289 RepID=A0A7I4Y3R4_HAECO|nr:WW domain-containing protein [Haemonchus contortus]
MQPMVAVQSNQKIFSPQASNTMFMNDFRELRSNPIEGKIQAQELFIYRPPLHPSEIQGCTVFDTCAIVNTPDVMDLSVKNHVLVIIPFPVLTELDRLNKNSGNNELRAKARVAMRRLRQLHSSRYVELEDSNDSKRGVDGIIATNNDERILRCAYRIQTALPPDCLHAGKILFVTDDCNLSLKAAAHAVKCMTSEEYCTLMDQSRIPEVPEEPMDVDPDPEPDPITTQRSTSEVPVPRIEGGKPTKTSRASKPKVQAKAMVKSKISISQALIERLETPGTKRRLQLRARKKDNIKVIPRSGRDKSPIVGLDKENDTIEIAKSSDSHIASHPGTATDRPSRWQEYRKPQNLPKYYQEQSEKGRVEVYHDALHPPQTPISLLPNSKSDRTTSPLQPSRQPHSTLRKEEAKGNLYRTSDDRDKTPIAICHRCKRSCSVEETSNSEEDPTSSRRARSRKNRKSSVEDNPKCRTACSRTPSVSNVSSKHYSSSARQAQQFRPDQEDSSRKNSQSASELALIKFLEIWKGLVAKVIEKIARGNPSEKAKTDIRKLRECARQLCESGELNHLKELVDMTSTLYYYYTFDPAFKNLGFAPAVLSGLLSLMLSRATVAADELVDSIMGFVVDPSVLSC